MRLDQPQTLADRAYERIKHAILSGDVQAWTSLTEPALARRLRISRTPVREALQRLAREGLVRLVPQRGALVTVLTADDWRELFDLREVLEGLAARLAAERVPQAELDELVREHEGLSHRRHDTSTERDRIAFGRKLHGLVMREARSSRLEQMVSLVAQQVQMLGEFQLSAEGRVDAAYHEHGELVDALRRRDPDAAEALMRLHVRNSRDTAFRLLPGPSLAPAGRPEVRSAPSRRVAGGTGVRAIPG